MTEVATPIETRADETVALTSPKTESGTQTVLPLNLAEFEALIRRIVREEVGSLLQPATPPIVDDWSDEGPDDAADDEELARDALAVLQKYSDTPEAWTSLEEFEAELTRAEAAGELPD